MCCKYPGVWTVGSLLLSLVSNVTTHTAALPFKMTPVDFFFPNATSILSCAIDDELLSLFFFPLQLIKCDGVTLSTFIVPLSFQNASLHMQHTQGFLLVCLFVFLNKTFMRASHPQSLCENVIEHIFLRSNYPAGGFLHVIRHTGLLHTLTNADMSEVKPRGPQQTITSPKWV